MFFVMEIKVCFIKEVNLYLIFGIVYFFVFLIVLIGNGVMFYIVRRDLFKFFNKFINEFNVLIGLNYFIVSFFVFLIFGINSVL